MDRQTRPDAMCLRSFGSLIGLRVFSMATLDLLLVTTLARVLFKWDVLSFCCLAFLRLKSMTAL